MPTVEEVKEIFVPLGCGEMKVFFADHVDENVDWTVKGTHCPIAGHYKSAADFLNGTKALTSTWAVPLTLQVQNVIASGKQAVVELKAVGVTCKNGLPFPNEYAWALEFNDQNKIVKVRAYMDTDLVTKAIEQNPSN